MKFVIDGKDLGAACNIISRVSPRIIGSIWLTSTETGQVLAKTIGDSIYLEYELNAGLDEPGAAAVSISSLGVLNGLAGTINVRTTDKHVYLDGNLHLALNQYNIDPGFFDRPADMPTDNWLAINSNYRNIVYAAGDPKLNRDALHFASDTWAFCADGYRMAGLKFIKDGRLDAINIRADYLPRLETEAGDVKLAVVGNRIWVKSGPLLAAFPTYTARPTPVFDILAGTMGLVRHMCMVSVDKSDLLPIVSTLFYLATSIQDKAGMISLIYENNALKVSAMDGNQIGSGDGYVTAEFLEGEQGPVMDISISPLYLLDALKHCTEDTLMIGTAFIELENSRNPVFAVYDGDNAVHMFAPKRYPNAV